MSGWKDAWREDVAPRLPAAGLQALAAALREDSLEVAPLHTTVPTATPGLLDEPVRCACPVGYALWKGLGLATVGQVDEAFARLGLDAGPGSLRWVMAYVDEAPWDDVRRELAAEAELAAQGREVQP